MAQTISQLDSYERIRARLLTNGVLGAVGTSTAIWMTSRLHGEGVTTVCVGVAQVLAQSRERSVLLIDSAPSRRGVADMLRLNEGPMLAVDSLISPDALPRHIVSADKFGFDILRIGGSAIQSTHWEGVWRSLKARYNVILVDAGPLGAGGSYGWARWSDHTVVVVDPQSTTYESLERFRSELENSTVRIGGFILNKRPFPVPQMIYRLIS